MPERSAPRSALDPHPLAPARARSRRARTGAGPAGATTAEGGRTSGRATRGTTVRPGWAYKDDISGWSEDQAVRLRRVATGEARPGEAGVDWANVIEEIESVGRFARSTVLVELLTGLRLVLLAHRWPDYQEACRWLAAADSAGDGARVLRLRHGGAAGPGRRPPRCPRGGGAQRGRAEGRPPPGPARRRSAQSPPPSRARPRGGGPQPGPHEVRTPSRAPGMAADRASGTAQGARASRPPRPVGPASGCAAAGKAARCVIAKL
jgi:hypothetical protein